MWGADNDRLVAGCDGLVQGALDEFGGQTVPAEFLLDHGVGEDTLVAPALGVGEELGEARRTAGAIGKNLVGAASALVAFGDKRVLTPTRARRFSLSPALIARLVCTFRQ